MYNWGRRILEGVYKDLFWRWCFISMCLNWVTWPVIMAWYKNSKPLSVRDVRYVPCYWSYMLYGIFYTWDKAAVFNWHSAQTGGIPSLLSVFESPNYRMPVLLHTAVHSGFILLQVPGEGWWMHTALWSSQCNNSYTEALISLRFFKALEGSCRREVWESVCLSFQVVITTLPHSSADCTNSPNLLSKW